MKPQVCAALDKKSLGVALLVDDEALVRMITADMLLDLGYEVVVSSSAEEAWKLLEDGLQVDVLITDHLMQGMSGGELARRVNGRGGRAIPVLIISAYVDAKIIPANLGRLGKPFLLTDLAASLAGLVRQPPPPS